MMKFTSKKTQQLIRIGLLHKYLCPLRSLPLLRPTVFALPCAWQSPHSIETCIPQQLGGYRIKLTGVKRPAVQYVRAALATSRGGKSTASRLGLCGIRYTSLLLPWYFSREQSINFLLVRVYPVYHPSIQSGELSSEECHKH